MRPVPVTIDPPPRFSGVLPGGLVGGVFVGRIGPRVPPARLVTLAHVLFKRISYLGETPKVDAYGVVAVVLDRTGQLLTLDDQNDLVLRDSMAGCLVVMVASNAILKSASDVSFSSSNTTDLVVDQALQGIMGDE